MVWNTSGRMKVLLNNCGRSLNNFDEQLNFYYLCNVIKASADKTRSEFETDF